jgi:uncharacterized protein
MVDRRNGHGNGTGKREPRNVLGGPLETCCISPRTGFYRSGSCETGTDDAGSHTVCAQVTPQFLEFSLTMGNDLITPAPQFDFPGLKPGDRWCLSVGRWKQALDAGVAPPVVLRATHEAALEVVSLADLQAHALDWKPGGS